MVRFYKTIEDLTFYSECWQEGDMATHHSGTIGFTGRVTKIPCEHYETHEMKFIQKYVKQDYLLSTDEILETIIIQIAGRDATALLETKDELVKMLDETLGWLGLGHIDGYDIDVKRTLIKKQYLNVFCKVIDKKVSIPHIKDVLKKIGISKFKL